MLLADFIVSYPEFAPAQSSGLVQAKLDEAELSLNATIYGNRFDEAHGLLAAHLLSISPFARNNRMVDDEQNPVSYEDRFKQVRAEVAPRGFVT